jgi:uncharacterized protein (DUF1778 family)
MDKKTRQLPTVRISEANEEIVKAAAEKQELTVSQWIHKAMVKTSERVMGVK